MTDDRMAWKRKQQIRRRKRKISRIRNIILCMMFLFVCIGILRWIGHKITRNTAAETIPKEAQKEFIQLEETERKRNYFGVRQEYLDEIEKMEKQDSRIVQLLKQEEIYPDRLLRILAGNIETLDFVLDYPEKKNRSCAEEIGEEIEEGEIPLLIQWDERWGYGAYGNSIVGVSGCGPTCIAMVASGLTGRKDITPFTVASYSEENGFLTEELDTSWDLMTYGCETFGIFGTILGLDELAMANTLDNGFPIICSVGPGDFTQNGHFIVLTGYENGEFKIHDPNSRERSEETWSFETLKDQIVNMWYYTLTE